MTERIYYTEPSCRAFEATVTRVGERDGRPLVVLDRTAFYPTSGGQPFDTGRLGSVDVVETIDEGEDIVHVVSAPRRAGRRACEARSTGPAGSITCSSTPVSTCCRRRSIGSSRIEPSAFTWAPRCPRSTWRAKRHRPTIERAVDEANRVVWEDREVSVRFVSADEAARLPLRKEPVREGTAAPRRDP